MNKFIEEMLELGAHLDQSCSGIEASMIINDAEILYDKHVKELNCNHNYVYKILSNHTAADVCTKCKKIVNQRG